LIIATLIHFFNIDWLQRCRLHLLFAPPFPLKYLFVL
jgi:hypothetical protein